MRSFQIRPCIRAHGISYEAYKLEEQKVYKRNWFTPATIYSETEWVRIITVNLLYPKGDDAKHYPKTLEEVVEALYYHYGHSICIEDWRPKA